MYIFSSLRQISQIKTVLSAIVGEVNVSSGKSVLNTHGQDCSHHLFQSPHAVAWPSNVEQIQKIARFCTKQRIPMIPYGTGTGLEGRNLKGISIS